MPRSKAPKMRGKRKHPFIRSINSEGVNPSSATYLSGNISPLSYSNRNYTNYYNSLLLYKNPKKDPTYIFSKNVSP